MKYDVFTLIGLILDRITQDQSDIFIFADGENVIIEFSDINLITNLILPLCDNECIELRNAKLIFANGVVSKIIMENCSGDQISNDVEEKLCEYVADFGKDNIYCQICAEIIEYATLVLTT